MKDLTRLTFVLPVFNGEATVRETVDSILAQSMKEIKLFIIDNGSTDKTISILEAYNDPRISIYKKFHVEQLGKSLNRALHPDFQRPLCVCHADDVYHMLYAEKMLKNIEKFPNTDIFFCNAKIIDEQGCVIISVKNSLKKLVNMLAPKLSGDGSALRLIFFNTLIAPSACFTTNFDPKKYGFHSEYVFFTDIHLWCALLFSNHKIRALNFHGIFYRVHEKQQSTQAKEWQKQLREMNGLKQDFSQKAKWPKIFYIVFSLAIAFRFSVHFLRNRYGRIF
jgi:glycosyltransferase involved in cell wall biosynthesis